MSQDIATDLIRWTFTVQAEKSGEIESYLLDLGLDVTIQDDTQFSVSWEDPELDSDPIIEQLWALNGEPFEVTHEAFHRLSLMVFHHDDEAGAAA